MMRLEEKLREIDEFFDSLTMEEFESIAIEAGAEDLYVSESTNSLSINLPLNMAYDAKNNIMHNADRSEEELENTKWNLSGNSILKGAA
ncbi:hypothetical protein [Sellimonas catena]|uniref:Uncharacterized protein n=2 Tax=Lachnospiraceae TaxID=186803 RepID=A0A9W6CAH3_9FIRM|nr:hypothetical protein Selli2_12330 [Sellimonas catena]